MLSNLPQEKREEAIAKFDKITVGKMLTTEEAKEYAEMATLYVNKDKIKTEKRASTLADFASTNVSGSTNPTANKGTSQAFIINDAGEVVLDSNSTK